MLEADYVLVSTGRRPYTAGLNLEKVGLETNKQGQVEIDSHFQTKVPGIYAIGDVVRGAMLAHKAEEEGIAAVEIMKNQAGHVFYEAIPGVVYTHPELASVGYTEEQLKEKGIPYKAGSFPFMPNGRAKAMEDTEGFVKILGHAETGALLGMHIVGPRAGDLIHEGVLVLEYGGTVEDLARSSHAHPSLPEVIKEAAMVAAGHPLHM
jgi:dihydrolipoamide dehydrogenase